MKGSSKRAIHILLAVLFAASLANCGGGGSSSSDGSVTGNASAVAEGVVMTWSAPEAYADSTPLDPETDLEEYEIYINETGEFDSDDEPVAYVSATDANGNATTTFDLGNLDYFFVDGGIYYVSMRSVTKSGVKSDFSTAFRFRI